MSQRESNTVYPRNPVDEMDLTLISGPTVTAPTSALTEGPGPAPGGGEALSEIYVKGVGLNEDSGDLHRLLSPKVQFTWENA